MSEQERDDRREDQAPSDSPQDAVSTEQEGIPGVTPPSGAAAAWSRIQRSREITLPGVYEDDPDIQIRIRPVSLVEMVHQGQIPQQLLHVVMKSVTQGRDELGGAEWQRYLEAMRGLAEAAVVEPKVTCNPEDEDIPGGVIYVGNIPDAHLVLIADAVRLFQARKVDRFRDHREQRARGDAGSGGAEVRQSPVDPAGGQGSMDGAGDRPGDRDEGGAPGRGRSEHAG